jgi:hypothetical protein
MEIGVQGIEILLMIVVLRRGKKPFKRHKYEKTPSSILFYLGID